MKVARHRRGAAPAPEERRPRGAPFPWSPSAYPPSALPPAPTACPPSKQGRVVSCWEPSSRPPPLPAAVHDQLVSMHDPAVPVTRS